MSSIMVSPYTGIASSTAASIWSMKVLSMLTLLHPTSSKSCSFSKYLNRHVRSVKYISSHLTYAYSDVISSPQPHLHLPNFFIGSLYVIGLTIGFSTSRCIMSIPPLGLLHFIFLLIDSFFDF